MSTCHTWRKLGHSQLLFPFIMLVLSPALQSKKWLLILSANLFLMYAPSCSRTFMLQALSLLPPPPTPNYPRTRLATMPHHLQPTLTSPTTVGWSVPGVLRHALTMQTELDRACLRWFVHACMRCICCVPILKGSKRNMKMPHLLTNVFASWPPSWMRCLIWIEFRSVLSDQLLMLALLIYSQISPVQKLSSTLMKPVSNYSRRILGSTTNLPYGTNFLCSHRE